MAEREQRVFNRALLIGRNYMIESSLSLQIQTICKVSKFKKDIRKNWITWTENSERHESSEICGNSKKLIKYVREPC